MINSFKKVFIISLLIISIFPTLLFAADPDKDPFYTRGDIMPISTITERVDPFSGYVTIVQRDIHLPGNGGLDLDIVRTYNSAIWGRRDTSFPGLIAVNERSPLGIGWSLHMGIVRNPYGSGSSNRFLPDNPVVEMPDGSQHTLYRDKNVSTRFITRDYWIYENVGNGIWQLTLTDGTRYTFEYGTNAGYNTMAGQQIAQATLIEHANRVSKITISYDKSHNSYSYIDNIVDSTGRTIDFYYDYTNHRLTRISGAGITYNYSYTTINSANFLIEAEPPVGNSWQYSYNSSTYEMNKITYPYGGTISYSYGDIWFDTGVVNVKFRVVAQRTTGGRGITSGTWTYSYNSGGSSGDITTVNAPDSYQEVFTNYGWGNSGVGYVWRIGLPISKKIYKSSSLIYSETYSWSSSASISLDDTSNADWTGTGGSIYDAYIYVPLLLSKSIVRDSQTYTTNYSNYDSYGNPETIAESGNSSRTTSISYWYNTSKNIVQNKPSSETVTGSFSGSFTTSYSHNSDGSVSQLNRYGVTTNYGYYSNGNLQSETNARSKTTSYEWSYGVIKKTITPEYTINRSINSNGTIASETNGRGYTTNFTYDGNLRITKIDPPAGNDITFSYHPSDSSYRRETRGSFYTYYFYDGFGRLSSTTNSKGVDTDTDYRAYGTKNYFNSEIGDEIYYDSFERAYRIVHKDGNDINYSYSGSNVTMTNETGGTTTYTYRAFGNPDEKFLTAVNDPDSNTTSYGRNILGSLTSITQGSISRSFVYNTKNFLTSEDHPETGNITYGRDAVGNMTSRHDSSGTRTYTYDGNDRVTRISTSSDGAVDFDYDGADNRTSMTGLSASISYTHDTANRLTEKRETISGRTYSTDYSYDGNDNITDIYYPTGLHVTYHYNSNNEVTSVAGFGGTVNSFSYNLAGLPTSYSYSNGKNTNITYNSRYFTTRITSSGAVDIGYTSYDSRGNVKAITNYLDSAKNQSFNYDSLDRLTSFNGAWGSGSYSYSTSGNRTHKTVDVSSTNYSYSTSTNRLSSTSGGEPATYSYYGNGNLQQLQKDGTTYSLTYDDFGNMTEYSTGGTPLADFGYDGDGMRVKKIASGKTTVYHYDQAGKVIAETDDAGYAAANYIYANGKLVAKTIPDVPGDPSGLNALPVLSTQINLTWTDNSNDEDGFNIFRKETCCDLPSEPPYELIATVGPNVTNYADTGLLNGALYYYEIQAYNHWGPSGFSNEAYATTFGADPPNDPSPLSATAISPYQVNLSWNNVENELGYYIERKTGIGGTYSQIASVSSDVTTYQDTGLSPTTTYYYRIRAYNEWNPSGYSNENYATTFGEVPPDAPSGLTATAVSPSRIDLTWNDPGNESSFHIERKTGGGSYQEIASVGLDVTSYSDTGCASEETYYYQVRAYNQWGYSGYSNEAFDTTLPLATWDIEVVGTNFTQDTLNPILFSLAIDSSNKPHVSFTAGTDYKLKYATKTGTSWNKQTVYDSSSTYSSAIAIDSLGNPHIGFYYNSAFGSTGFFYAKWNGSTWDFPMGKTYERYPSIAIDNSNNAHLSFYNFSSGDISYRKWDGSAGNVLLVDNVGRSKFIISSIAVDSADNPHIAYYDGVSGDLKYASFDGYGWNIDVVDGNVDDVGQYASLELDSFNRPHISYYDATNQDLKYAYWDGTSWIIQRVDTDGDVGLGTSIDVDSYDRPHISYFDKTLKNVKYAKLSNTSWYIQTIGSAKAKQVNTSLALDSFDVPHIVYVGPNWELNYATIIDNDGDTILNDGDGNGNVGDNPCTGGNVVNCDDNCIDIPNSDQADADSDGVGDACEPNILPIANPAGPYSGNEGQSITFDASLSGDPDGSIVLYEWDVNNDGIYEYSSSSSTQNHTHAQQGTYTIKLRVTDDLGATDTATTTATISDTDPTADFTASPTTGPAPLTVYFTNTSTGYDQPLAYAWDFDNNGTIDSTTQNPSYIYSVEGTYTVKLTVTDSDGSPNSTIKTNYITVTSPGCTNPPVKIGSNYYSTIQDAYNAAVDGDVIQIQAVESPGSLNTSLGKNVIIRGGYDCNYTVNTWETTLTGSQKINSGRIKMDSGRIKLK